MNYYNPYFYSIPTALSTPKVGLFSRLFGGSGLTLGKIFNGTQRVLNFANQAIPLVKQVRPMIGNAKTMFKVMNEFKKTEKPQQNKKQNENIKVINQVQNTTSINNINTDKNTNNYTSNDDGPTFFI